MPYLWRNTQTQQASNNDMLFVNSLPIIINNLKKEGNSPYGYKNTTPLAQLTKDYGAIVVKADSTFKDLKSVLIEATRTVHLSICWCMKYSFHFLIL